MIKYSCFLTIFFLMSSCSVSANNDGLSQGFEEILKGYCKLNSISEVSRESCNVEGIDKELKSRYFEGNASTINQLSYSDLEVVVNVLGMSDYVLALASSYLKAGFDCKAWGLVGGSSNDSSVFLYNQAIYYYKGVCVEKSYEKAFSIFYRAAKKGHLDSSYNVAIMYYFGKGTRQDVPLSGEIFSILAAFNHKKAINFVYMLIDKGYADEKNFKDAVSSRRPIYQALKERNSHLMLIGEDISGFIRENNIKSPVPFDSLRPPIAK